MRATVRWILPFAILPTGALGLLEFSSPAVQAGPKPETYWQVDDVRAGMKGTGRTVLRGTKVEEFQAEVLGVLKNTSPGRDMVLCRLSGLDLEKTGTTDGSSGNAINPRRGIFGARPRKKQRRGRARKKPTGQRLKDIAPEELRAFHEDTTRSLERKGVHHHDAEDHSHDGIYKTLRKEKRQPLRNAKGHSYAAALNSAKTQWRDESTHAKHHERIVRDSAGRQTIDDPYHQMELDELPQAVENAVRGLPKAQRLIVRYRWQDYSLREIARKLDLSLSTVRRLWSAACAQLRPKLGRYL